MRFYPGYTVEMVFKLPIRRFFLLCRHMTQIEAQENLIQFMISNFQLLGPETRRRLSEELWETAYPEIAKESSRWWEAPAKGLRRAR